VGRASIVGMARAWCVCGLVPHDSGKTWLSIALTKALKTRGVRVAVSKPVAGHSAWTQRHTLRYSEELGILVGEDAYAYVKQLGIDKDMVPYTNPVDLLLAPPSAINAIKRGSLSAYVAKLEESVGQVVLARVPGRGLEPKHYLIEDNLALLPQSLRERIMNLSQKLGAERVELSDFLSLLKSRRIEDRICECINRVSESADVLIVESFNDALVPILRLISYIELFVLCAVGSVALYRNSDALIRALELEVAMRGEEALRTQFALSRVRPEAVLELDFVNSVDELTSSPSIHRLLELLPLPASASRAQPLP